jgi:hypothetical protein
MGARRPTTSCVRLAVVTTQGVIELALALAVRMQA